MLIHYIFICELLKQGVNSRDDYQLIITSSQIMQNKKGIYRPQSGRISKKPSLYSKRSNKDQFDLYFLEKTSMIIPAIVATESEHIKTRDHNANQQIPKGSTFFGTSTIKQISRPKNSHPVSEISDKKYPSQNSLRSATRSELQFYQTAISNLEKQNKQLRQQNQKMKKCLQVTSFQQCEIQRNLLLQENYKLSQIIKSFHKEEKVSSCQNRISENIIKVLEQGREQMKKSGKSQEKLMVRIEQLSEENKKMCEELKIERQKNSGAKLSDVTFSSCIKFREKSSSAINTEKSQRLRKLKNTQK